MCEVRGTVANRLAIGVIDDDASVREALKGLLRASGFSVEVFSSAEDFLTSGDLEDTACLILDVRMPGIFITADGDRNVRTRALANGAVDFLQKPFKDQALPGAIEKALGRLHSP